MAYPEVQGVVRTIYLNNMRRRQQKVVKKA